MRRAQIPGVDDVDIILAHETWEMKDSRLRQLSV